MKKRKFIAGIICIIIIIAIVSIFIKNKKKNNIHENETGEVRYNIKSTEKNPIVKDNVEASDIDIVQNGTDVEVTTTLKNKENKDLKGFFIHIVLYDENDNQLTEIALNANDTIPANGTFLFKAAATLDNENARVKSAKITDLGKNESTRIEEDFSEIENSVEEKAN